MNPTDLQTQALDELNACAEESALKAWSSRYLGKTGLLTDALKKLGSLPAPERPAYGQAINLVKQALLAARSIGFSTGPSGAVVSDMLAKMGIADGNIYTSLENRMKCGLGKCGRCNCGPVYVCKEGPIFTMEQLKKMPNDY